MGKKNFQNAPLQSLLNDKKILETLKENVESLKSELAQGRGGLEGLGSPVGMEEDVDGLEVLLDGRESTPGGFGSAEAIVLLTGRPPLLIQGGTWEEPRVPEIRARMEQSRASLEAAIAKVARVELINHPTQAYVGTGWMIAETVMITNRHVANTFARSSGDSILMRTTPFGTELEVQVDFNEEHDSPNPPFEVEMEEVLFIEEDVSGKPDMALIRLKKMDNLPEPIELSQLKLERDDDVAVIGYPARDAGRNDPFVMAELFKNIYDVKRISPGRVSGVRSDRFILTHDCTTLGGNSGSAVINLKDGKAAGLHFAGSFKENNFAVTSETIRKRLSELNSELVVTMPASAAPQDAAAEELPSRSELESRAGYDADFLGTSVPLPTIKGDFEFAPVKNRDDNLLHYTHFSLAMHGTRRLTSFTACNIDGEKMFSIRRGRDTWGLDPRMEDRFQVGNELYRRNPLDRGHLVRRLDPAWGETREEATQANDDTFFYTNSSPQHSRLNQQTWLSLEDYILDNAATHDLKVTVFTGPVFSSRDREYRGILLPEEYWKVVVIVNEFTDTLSATGYLLSQTEFVEDLEFAFGEFRTYQLPIRTIEQKTGLAFGDLPSHDPLDRVESIGVRTVTRAGDLML